MAVTSKTINELTDRYGAKYPLTCGLSKYFPVMNGTSKVYWVDGASGDDAAPGAGQTPDAPLKTIVKALSLCSADLPHDFIFVWNCSNTDTYPIQIAKSFIHIIGAWALNSPTWIDGDTDDDAAIEFLAGGANCELANLELGAGDDYAGIEVSGNGIWGNHIHDCRFGMSIGMGGKNGIASTGTGEMINWIIENCRFGTLLTGNSIDLISAGGANPCKGTIIRRNYFQVAGSDHGINLAATQDLDDGGIYDNRFELEAEADNGEAIYFVSGAKGNVHNNYAWGAAGIALTHNPFFDAGTTNMSFGSNFRGAGEVATDTLRASGALATPTNI